MQVQNYFRTATILFYEGRMDEALNAINRYLELKPSNSLGFNNRALIHFHMGNCS
jgi:lipoprotein NlpI